MQVIDIDDFIGAAKAAAHTSGMKREYYINIARDLHRKHTKAELSQLVDEIHKFNKAEIKILFGIGIREPARKLILKKYMEEEIGLN